MGFPQLQSHVNALPSNDRTVGLTGVETAGALGAFVLAVSLAFSGVGGTGATGTLSFGDGGATLGTVVAAGGVGPLAPDSVSSLSGAEGTGAVTAPSVTLGLTGVQADTALGVLSAGTVFIERPRVVVGPFPFPKERPAFPISSPVVLLVGVGASGTAGALAGDAAFPLTGVEAQAALNAFQFEEALSGVVATAGVGDTVKFFTVGLSGVGATTVLSALAPSTPGFGLLTGVEGAGQVATAVPGVTVALSGVGAAGAVGAVRPTILVIDRPHSISGPFPFLTGGMFQFRERPRLVNPPSQPLTVQLIGVAAQGSVGSLVVLGGVGATGQVKAPTLALALALSGVEATPALGTFGYGQPLSGVAGTGGLGTQTPEAALALNGVSAGAVIDSLAAQNEQDITLGLTGVGTDGTLGSFAISADLATIGTAGTAEAGTLAPEVVVFGPDGVEAAALGGTLAPSGTGAAALVGVEATVDLTPPTALGGPLAEGKEALGDVGTVVPDCVVTLAGLEAIGGPGTLLLGQPVVIDLIGTYDVLIDLRGTHG